MKARLLVLAVLFISGGGCSEQSETPLEPLAKASVFGCSGQFTGTVRIGPDAGFVLSGKLTIRIDEKGVIEGMLVRENAAAVRTGGQANGRAINLIFHLPDEKIMFGVGTLENDIRECRGAVGGPLVGPAEGDIGDWAYALGG